MTGTSPLESIFFEALAKPTPDARAVFLNEACGSDQELRGSVERMLAAHVSAGSFLEPPAADLSSTVQQPPITEQPGAVIGPYKLLQQIGEGGMGVVFMAEQSHPIQRVVALKIIKPGMDTRQVIARFEAERQALALMDHPNIAKVLDAGTTDTGRPYFVMDLVKGTPITSYCDDKNLSLRERLELFLPVCQAVQHAHQKGIIHRDLKPTNILVAEYDNHAVPKVIDFGVAKATVQKLTERTMFTEFGQIIGTVEYMSPEQAKFNQLDIDTRTDIYSLGVLLYELLAGSTPFERSRLRDAAFDEVLRIIREEEPPKPSTRLGHSDTLPAIAAHRHTEPQKLTSTVRGELDWIVMRSLEKDRGRRYPSADALADDLKHYLDDQPVSACPPSSIYRFKKFVRRNRGVLIALALTSAALVLGAGISLWQAIRATQAEQLTRAERDAKEEARQEAVSNARQAHAVSDFLVEILRAPHPKRDGRKVTIAEVLQRATGQLDEKFVDDPGSKAALLHAIGESYRGLGLYDDAISQLEKGLDLRMRLQGRRHLDTIRCARDLGWAYLLSERLTDALPKFEENLKITAADLGDANRTSLQCASDLATCYYELGRYEDSLKLIEPTFVKQEATFGRHDVDTVESMDQLALSYNKAGRVDEAVKLLQEAITVPNQQHPLFKLAAMQDLADLYGQLGRYEEAVPLIEETVKVAEEWLGPDALGSRRARDSRASIYAAQINSLANSENLQRRDPDRALALARKAVEVDPKIARALLNLGLAEFRMHHWEASLEALQKSCEAEPGGTGNAFQWFFLSMAHWHLGHKDDARKWYNKAVEWMDKQNPNNEDLKRSRAEAGELLGISEKQSTKSAPPKRNP